jgi:hypothetical protein
VQQDLIDGQHRNPSGRPEYFHHPEELRAEVTDAGFAAAKVYGVEGPSWLLSDFGTPWDNVGYQIGFCNSPARSKLNELFGSERSPHGRGNPIGNQGWPKLSGPT